MGKHRTHIHITDSDTCTCYCVMTQLKCVSGPKQAVETIIVKGYMNFELNAPIFPSKTVWAAESDISFLHFIYTGEKSFSCPHLGILRANVILQSNLPLSPCHLHEDMTFHKLEFTHELKIQRLCGCMRGHEHLSRNIGFKNLLYETLGTSYYHSVKLFRHR